MSQTCFFATQAAEKALKGAIVELGLEPPHTHGLPQLVARHGFLEGVVSTVAKQDAPMRGRPSG